MDELRSQEAVTQNLMDAGCGEKLIRQFWAAIAAGKKRESLALLARHRQSLLDCCHAEQRKIDCLDYLVYQLKQEHHEEEFQHGRKADLHAGMG